MICPTHSVIHAMPLKDGRLYFFTHLTALYAGRQDGAGGDQMRPVRVIIRY